MHKDLNELEEILGVEFKNLDVLNEAITHRSYLNENLDWKCPNNERLEFLGDAVLELIITELLFLKYPQYNEGRMTSIRAALVNYQNLAEVAKMIGLENFILMSKGELQDTGKARDVILANAFESVLGAIYLDAGYDKTRKFIEKNVFPKAEEIAEKNLDRDAKSLFQELAQEKFKITPNYSVMGERGPDHKKLFKVGLFIGDKMVAEGEGYSKQEAETEAAKKGLHDFETS